MSSCVQDASQRLREELRLASPPAPHPLLPYALQLRGRGPLGVNYDTLCGERASRVDSTTC